MHGLVVLLIALNLAYTQCAQITPPFVHTFNWKLGSTLSSIGIYNNLTRQDPGGHELTAIAVSSTSLYIYGGLALHATTYAPVVMGDLWSFDKGNATWTWLGGVREPMSCSGDVTFTRNTSCTPGPRVGASMWFSSSVYGTFLYLYGGQSTLSAAPFADMWIFHTLTNSWQWMQLLSDYPEARISPSTVYDGLNDRFWLVGGYLGAPINALANQVWTFHFASLWTKEWQSSSNVAIYFGAAAQPEIRMGAAVWIADDYLWYYGGNTTARAEMWRFNGAWTSIANYTYNPSYPTGNLTTCGSCHPGSRSSMIHFSDDDFLYLSGGYIPRGNTLYVDRWKYAFRNNTWYLMSRGTPLAATTDGFRQESSSACSTFLGGTPKFNCWVFGGRTLDNSPYANDVYYTSSAEDYFTLVGGQSSPVLPLFPLTPSSPQSPHPPSLQGASLTAVGDELYISLGYDGSNYNAYTWKYQTTGDSLSWTFVPTSGMVTSNLTQFALSWSNKTHIWYFGGKDGSNSNANMWRFDIKTKVWTPVYTPGKGVGPDMLKPWPSARASSQGAFDGRYFWMYGGFGWDIYPNLGFLSDLWRFDVTTEKWKYINGSLNSGETSTSKIPGGVQSGMICTDGNYLWMFGGFTFGMFASEFWQFSINSSTWRLLTKNNPIVYPPLGGTSSAASPGARDSGALFYSYGSVFLYGGFTSSGNLMNDLWSYPINETTWYWLGGSNSSFSSPFYVSNPYVKNIPAGRDYASYASLGSSLWFYGGAGRPDPAFPTTTIIMSDLWSITIAPTAKSISKATFQYLSGMPLTAEAQRTNTVAFPGARMASAFCDAGNGELWMYGGLSQNTGWLGYMNAFGRGIVLSDLWKVAKTGTNWRLEKGFFSDAREYPAAHMAASQTSTPGPLMFHLMWTQSNKIWLFGGLDNSGYGSSDLWKYDPVQKLWYWVDGNGTSALGSSTYPGSIWQSASAISNGDLWFYGGWRQENSLNTSVSSQLWHYNTATNIWKMWDAFNATDSVNYPQARVSSTMWVDSYATIWVYGGFVGTEGQADMFSFNPTNGQWKLMAGTRGDTDVAYSAGINTTCGACTPGSRGSTASSWVDGTDLYLIGGSSRHNGLTLGYADITKSVFSDIWRYSTTLGMWYWMGGEQGPLFQNASNVPTMYPPPLLAPASYYDSSTASVSLFGGMLYNTTLLSQFLELNTQTLSWTAVGVQGDQSAMPLYPSPPGVSTPASSSVVLANPGSTTSSYMQVKDDVVYLHSGYTARGYASFWEYKTTDNEWSYLGDTPSDQFGFARVGGISWVLGDLLYVFGGVPLAAGRFSSVMYTINLNTHNLIYLGGSLESLSNDSWPGARFGGVGWVIERDLWLFGGQGFGNNTSSGLLSDMWRYSTDDKRWYHFTGSKESSNVYLPNLDEPNGRVWGTAAANRSHMWYYGGVTNNFNLYDDTSTNELWQYELAIDKWTLLSNIPMKYPENPGVGGALYSPGFRTDSASAYVKGSIFIFGGALTTGFGESKLMNDVWEYNLESRMWYWLAGSQGTPSYSQPITNTSIPTGRFQFASTAYADGIYLYGGLGESIDYSSQVPVAIQFDLADFWFIRIQKNTSLPPDNYVYNPTTTTGGTSSIATTTGSTTSAICGDGIVQYPEACDSSPCCTSSCTFVRSGEVCRTSAGVCDREDSCSGKSGECRVPLTASSLSLMRCEDDFQSPGYLCNYHSSNCTIPMVCGSNTSSCPAPLVLTLDECRVCGGDNTSCTLNGTCGDGVCNSMIGETCTSCFLDCGRCDVVNPTCVRNCNGNGLCTNGTCSCYANFSGSACDREIQQILAQVNGTEAKLQLGTQVYFNLKLKSISEIALNSSVISTYAIQTQNVETISETINGTQTWNYTAKFPNNAFVIIHFLKASTPTQITFANNTRILQPESVKVTIEVVNWPFNTIKNHLEISLTLDPDSTQRGKCQYYNSSSDSSGNVKWAEFTINQVSLYGTFLDYAWVDEVQRPLQVKSSSDGAVLTFILPHFWVHAVIDPDFSVLLGRPSHESSDPCAHIKNNRNNSTHKAAVSPSPLIFSLPPSFSFILSPSPLLANEKLL